MIGGAEYYGIGQYVLLAGFDASGALVMHDHTAYATIQKPAATNRYASTSVKARASPRASCG